MPQPAFDFDDSLHHTGELRVGELPCAAHCSVNRFSANRNRLDTKVAAEEHSVNKRLHCCVEMLRLLVNAKAVGECPGLGQIFPTKGYNSGFVITLHRMHPHAVTDPMKVIFLNDRAI